MKNCSLVVLLVIFLARLIANLGSFGTTTQGTKNWRNPAILGIVIEKGAVGLDIGGKDNGRCGWFCHGGPRLLSPGRMGGGPGWSAVLLLLRGVAPSRNNNGRVLVGSTLLSSST